MISVKVVRSVLFFTCWIYQIQNVKGQTCTSGFPYLSRSTGQPKSSDEVMTRIISGMRITCSGTLRGWTVAGTTSSNNVYPKLKIFRESGENYHFIGEVLLGQCNGVVAVQNGRGLYDCNLPVASWVPVQANDFIGIYLPLSSQIAFDVYFTTTTTDQANRIYLRDLTSTVSISSGAMSKNTPQINLEIGGPIQINVLSSTTSTFNDIILSPTVGTNHTTLTRIEIVTSATSSTAVPATPTNRTLSALSDTVATNTAETSVEIVSSLVEISALPITPTRVAKLTAIDPHIPTSSALNSQLVTLPARPEMMDVSMVSSPHIIISSKNNTIGHEVLTTSDTPTRLSTTASVRDFNLLSSIRLYTNVVRNKSNLITLTEITTTQFPKKSSENNTITIIAATVAMAITLLVVFLSGCLVLLLKRRSRKCNERIKQVNNEREGKERECYGLENNCQNAKDNNSDEECEKMNCAYVQVEDVLSSTCSDCSTPERKLTELDRENPLVDSHFCAQEEDVQGVDNSIEMKEQDQFSDRSLELMFEPAYYNIEGYFMELNQMF